MKTLPILAVTFLSLALPAFAQNPAPTYKLDTDASRVYVRVNRTNRLGHNHGIEGKLSEGAVTFGGTGKLVFDMTTFTADTARARKYVDLEGDGSSVDKVNANMRGADVLDVRRFPQATCAISAVAPADRQAAGAGGRYIIDAKFTLHGVTQSIRFLTALKGTATPGIVRLTGWFNVKQSDYGIKPYTVAGGAIGIEDELTIHGDLVLRFDAGK